MKFSCSINNRSTRVHWSTPIGPRHVARVLHAMSLEWIGPHQSVHAMHVESYIQCRLSGSDHTNWSTPCTSSFTFSVAGADRSTPLDHAMLLESYTLCRLSRSVHAIGPRHMARVLHAMSLESSLTRRVARIGRTTPLVHAIHGSGS